MSAYIDFFVRNEETFSPIGTFSRSTLIFEKFQHYTEWEKVAPITRYTIGVAKEQLNINLKNIDSCIEREQTEITLILQANNSLEEKREAIFDIQSSIKESVEYKDEIEAAIAYCDCLITILDSVEYDEDIKEERYIYVGLEIGHPTVEDIMEEKI